MLAIACGATAAVAGRPTHRTAQTNQTEGLGPELISYLEFLDSEAAELRYYLDGHEIAESDYRLGKDRLDLLREYAVRIARKRALDTVPDLYVVQAEDLTSIVPAGLPALKGKRSGDRVGDVWIFHGSVKRSAMFYILERTDSIKRAPVQ
jgi:hypothetical protein